MFGLVNSYGQWLLSFYNIVTYLITLAHPGQCAVKQPLTKIEKWLKLNFDSALFVPCHIYVNSKTLRKSSNIMNNSKVLDLGKRILAPLPLELDHKLSLYRICVLLLTFFCCSALPGMLSSTNKRDSKLKLATMIHRAGRELHQLKISPQALSSAPTNASDDWLTSPNLLNLKIKIKRIDKAS